MNDFEKRLQAEVPRQIPASWRHEIVSHAQAAERSSPVSTLPDPMPSVAGQSSGVHIRASVAGGAATGVVEGDPRAAAAAFRWFLHSLPSVSHLRALLWPHPRAWAALVGLWIVIAALNLSSTDPRESRMAARSANPPAPSPGVLLCLAEQQRMQRELLGLIPVSRPEPADVPKTAPPVKPQSCVSLSYRFA